MVICDKCFGGILLECHNKESMVEHERCMYIKIFEGCEHGVCVCVWRMGCYKKSNLRVTLNGNIDILLYINLASTLIMDMDVSLTSKNV